ncbi:MAG: tripartite tricarboxylate transporter permease [Oscillospiraceae bacterium]
MLMEVLTSVFNPMTLLYMMLGVVLGIFFGAMPGLNGPIGVALLLPLTYGLSPSNGLLMLSGLYMGSSFGGSISAILLNCPGTGEASCTALDGNPLAKQGRAKEALYYSVLSSAIGGIFGVLIMIFFTPILADAALKFGPPELFLVCMAGLAVVGSLMDKSISKGFFAVGFGLLLSMVGMDTMTSNYRFTFGMYPMQSGLNLIPVTVGFFALSEMMSLMGNKSGSILEVPMQDIKARTVLKNLFTKHWKTLTKSSIIGTIVGILPGTGGAVAAFVSYGEVRRSAKAKDRASFGKGNIDGIVAPESANNAAVGGSFVPLLALGIPGSATSAIIFGALTVHGLLPGPKLFLEHADIVNTLMYGMLLTVVVMAVVGIFGVPLFSKILKVDVKYIIPAVVVCSLLGAYSARNSMFDVGVAIVFGIIGLFFKRAKIPTAPVILALILGNMAEGNLRRSMITAGAKGVNLAQYIFVRPLSVVVFVLLLIVLYTNFKSTFMKQAKVEEETATENFES